MLAIGREWSYLGIYCSNVTDNTRMCFAIHWTLAFNYVHLMSQVNIFVLIATLWRIYKTAERHLTAEQYKKTKTAK